MIGAYEVTRAMFVGWKLGAEIDGRAASLPVIGAHREIVNSAENIGRDREMPTRADARNFQIELPALVERTEIRRLNTIARIGVEDGGLQRSAKCDGIISRATHHEGMGWIKRRTLRNHHGQLRLVRQVTRLIDFDVGGCSLKSAARAKERKHSYAR